MLSLLAIATAALAESPAKDAKAIIRVYLLRNVEDDRNLNVIWAQNIASQILAGAGVRIKWRLGTPRRSERESAIIIDLTSDNPKTLAPGALAYAQVFEGVHIKVFWDRVQNTVNGGSRLRTFLLAHVMAHEIVHILEGINRHSEAGLMKASWTKREIEEMSVQPLSLAPEDVRLIRNGLLKQATTGLRAGDSGFAQP